VAAPLVMNVFTLTGRVNDVHEATFVLDTGAQVTLLGPELAARCGLVAGEGRRTDGFGVGGSEPFQLQAIGSLEIGGLRVDAPVVATQLREGGALQVLLDAVGGAGAGVLGSNVLQEFVVTLDYGEQRVILERAARR